MLFISIALVLIAEMINTAIERAVDLITEEFHPLARLSKDIAAGGVLIAALNSLVVGYLLFFDRLNPFTNMVLFKIKKSPVYLTFVALVLVVLFTIVLKTKYNREKVPPFKEVQ